MEKKTCLTFFCLFISSAISAEAVKLFVFGDSYADTGNWPTTVSPSWKEPYGITFPGKPSGRFSDGAVLSDYIATFFGVKSPVPYNWRMFGKNYLQYGMNFAYGGTGVFSTLVNQPNMTMQIGFLQQLLEQKVFTKQDLSSSIALVSVAGNDYATYFVKDGSIKDLPPFTKFVINQLSLNLKSLVEMGIPKVLVTAMEPIGCLP